MRVQKISWILYFVGSLLVFGSWVNLVSTGVGWIGWLMAIIGWAIPNFVSPKRERERIAVPVQAPISRAEEIEKLQLLRKESVITEEEFLEEKQRILREK